jgi:hypothetical protein
MATLYKFNYRDHVKVRIEYIEAQDISEGRDMAFQYCNEQGFKLIDICPLIFPIKEYLALSNGGKTPQGKPENFGQLVERRKLQEKEAAAEQVSEKPIPAEPEPKKATAK